ncbi:MAG: hypothetical protein AAF708_07780 [Deinococcota bacterium]
MFSTLKATLKASFPKLQKLSLEHPSQTKYYWWQVPTLLSLDAPLVAYVWQQLITSAFGIRLSWQLASLLVCSVWLVYVADRCLDARTLSLQTASTARHRFYVVQGRKMWLAWAGVLAISVLLSMALSLRVRVTGLSMAGLAAAYLGFIHVLDWPLKLPKELLIASLFTLGVHFSVLVKMPLQITEAVSVLMFGLLCFLNCSLIAFWEQDADSKQGQVSIALARPSARRWLETCGLAVVIGSAVSWLLFPAYWPVWVCLLVSSLLLGMLEHLHTHLPVPLLRVLVDAALLTPVVVLAFR